MLVGSTDIMFLTLQALGGSVGCAENNGTGKAAGVLIVLLPAPVVPFDSCRALIKAAAYCSVVLPVAP